MSTSQSTQTHERVEQSVWHRLLYMVLFGFIGYVVFWLTLFTGVLQFIVRVMTGSVNAELAQLSSKLTVYLAEVLRFVTFQSEDRPFPFEDAGKDITVN